MEAVSELFLTGRFFKEGDTLLQLETADYDFAIARARGSGGRCRPACSRRSVAEIFKPQREWRDLGSSEANDLFLRKPQLRRRRERRLPRLRADVAAAELALARTTSRHPLMDGLKRKSVDLGQFVAPGAALAQSLRDRPR